MRQFYFCLQICILWYIWYNTINPYRERFFEDAIWTSSLPQANSRHNAIITDYFNANRAKGVLNVLDNGLMTYRQPERWKICVTYQGVVMNLPETGQTNYL